MSKESNGGSQPAAARVGKYLMLDLLGEGAFGKVRLAIDEKDGQQYAMKIMEKSRIKANELTLQVRREIAVMKAMRHPNIVNLHEVLTSSKNLYMVMDLVTGGELFDAVAEAGKLTEQRARLYFQQLVDGIHYCHTRRVYHRDLKPENLLLSADKQTIKITDFGLSSIKASNASSELLHTIMGSPHYIAPEIITSAAAGYDGAKVDVWASGIILYGMLAGFLPFDEPQMNELYRSIVHKHPSYPPHFSYDVLKVLRSMLQKDPTKRPTMDQVKQFTWFKVNYQPALHDESSQNTSEISLSSSSGSSNSKKTKPRTRAKKTAEKQVRRKKGSDTVNQNKQQMQQAAATQGGQVEQKTSPSASLHQTFSPSAIDGNNEERQQQNHSQQLIHHNRSQRDHSMTKTESRNSSHKSMGESDYDSRECLELESKSASPSYVPPLNIKPQQQNNELLAATIQDTSNRPPILHSELMDLKNNETESAQYAVNSFDLSNACVLVETPMPLSKYSSDQLRKQVNPFSTTKANANANANTNQYGGENSNMPNGGGSVLNREISHDNHNRIQNRNSYNNNHHNHNHHRSPLSSAIGAVMNKTYSCNNSDNGNMSSGSTPIHSATHRDLSGGSSSSSGFKEGVKKALESGFEALALKSSTSKSTKNQNQNHFASETKNLPLQNLFSANHPAEIPFHSGQPTDGTTSDSNTHKIGSDNHDQQVSNISTSTPIAAIPDDVVDVQSPLNEAKLSQEDATNDYGERKIDSKQDKEDLQTDPLESSPVSNRATDNYENDSNANGSIFKPVTSLFKPLSKTFTVEDETMTCSAEIFQPLTDEMIILQEAASTNTVNTSKSIMDESGIVSNEWGLDVGEVFGDVEDDGISYRYLQRPQIADKQTGTKKFINDLRRRQSVMNNQNIDKLNQNDPEQEFN